MAQRFFIGFKSQLRKKTYWRRCLAALPLLVLNSSGFSQDIQSLLETGGVFPEQPGQFSGGSRQTAEIGPIAIPRSGRVFMTVTSSPNVRQAVQNIERHDSAIEEIDFDGETISLRSEFPDCNEPGSNPAVCQSIWDPPSGGSLTITILGPATFNIFGEFSGHAAQNWDLSVQFQPGPDVTEVAPATGTIGGWEPVTVHGDFFAENAVVLFGGTAATETVVVSPQEITCLAPPSVAGVTDVLVLNPDPLELPYNFGRAWGLFGELPDGFAYTVPGPPGALEAEELLGTWSGFFKEQRSVNVDIDSRRQSADFAFNIPGAGRLRWEAWAFIPITSPVFGPPGNELNFEAFNDSTAVRGFTRGDGETAGANVKCTSLTFPFGPVICDSTQIVDATGSGAGEFRVLGPERTSALFNDFLSAPFQDWTLALWFADQPVVTSVEPANIPTTGGMVTVRGADFAQGARVFFGDDEATEVVVVDENTITCRAPAGDPGSADVSVVVFTSLRGSLEAGITYGEPAPTSTPVPTFTSTPQPTPTGTEPPPTPVVNVEPDDEINSLDVLIIIILVQTDQEPAEILFELARLWQTVIDQ